MTVAMLMKNTVLSAKRSAERLINSTWTLRPLQLQKLKPVPSDVAIARSQIPKDISLLSEEIGLAGSEISQYGSKKAKISLSVLKRLQNQPKGKYVVVVG